MLTLRIGLALLLVSGVATSANAQDCSQSIVVMPNEVAWKAPAVSPGVDTAVICGDPRNRVSMSCAQGFPPASSSCRTSIPTNGVLR